MSAQVENVRISQVAEITTNLESAAPYEIGRIIIPTGITGRYYVSHQCLEGELKNDGGAVNTSVEAQRSKLDLSGWLDMVDIVAGAGGAYAKEQANDGSGYDESNDALTGNYVIIRLIFYTGNAADTAYCKNVNFKCRVIPL